MTLPNNLAKKLGIPSGGPFTQDWIYELPEASRTKEWLSKYIISYSNSDDSSLEKDELMQLILDITNDLLSYGAPDTDSIIIDALKLLSDNYISHLELIRYWSLDNEPLEDCFILTSRIRSMMKSKNNI
ncbi:hypothetical protein [Morganella morganii]|uniref:hypothetical protein n=1 Tax=Morganella morganii TaxID=582 RepID=UPI00339BF06B